MRHRNHKEVANSFGIAEAELSGLLESLGLPELSIYSLDEYQTIYKAFAAAGILETLPTGANDE
jgi:hypothetical protein